MFTVIIFLLDWSLYPYLIPFFVSSVQSVLKYILSDLSVITDLWFSLLFSWIICFSSFHSVCVLRSFKVSIYVGLDFTFSNLDVPSFD